MVEQAKSGAPKFMGVIGKDTGVSITLIVAALGLGAGLLGFAGREMQSMHDDLTSAFRTENRSLRESVEKTEDAVAKVAMDVAVQGTQLGAAIEDIRELKVQVAELRKELRAEPK